MRSRYLVLFLISVCIVDCSLLPPLYGLDAEVDLVVLISIDGCRWDYLRRVDTPNIDLLISSGVYVLRCLSVYPSLTRVGHTAILTGCYPESHGITGNVYYDRIEGVEKKFETSDIKVETLLETTSRFGLKSISVCFPMSRGATMAVDKGRVPDFLINVIGDIPENVEERDVWVLNATLMLIESEEPDIILVHFKQVDSMGHEFGPDSEEVYKAVRNVDGLIGKLIARLEAIGIADNTLIVLTADHGMASVSKPIPLRPMLHEKGFESYVVYDGRAAYIYLSEKDSPTDLLSFVRSVEGVESAIYGNYSLYHVPAPSDKTPDIFLTAKAGYFFTGKVTVRGQHGGVSLDDLRVPLIISGPTVPAGKAVWNASLVDVAPTICHILGIDPPAGCTGNVISNFTEPLPLEAKDKILEAEATIQEIGEKYNISLASNILDKAKSEMERGEYLDALKLASDSIEAAYLSMNASIAIEHAIDEIAKAKSEGRLIGIEDAEKLLSEAQDAYRLGDYEKAYLLANNATIIAAKAEKRGFISPFTLAVVGLMVVVIIVVIGEKVKKGM